MRRRLRALRREGGYSLIELLIVVIILGIILAGITGMFVSATTAQVDMDRRFQAQQAARLALDKVRREVHCASAVAVSSDSSLAVVTLPAGCPTGNLVSQTQVTWCAAGGSTPPFTLRRISGATGSCSGGTAWAEYLTTKAAFSVPHPRKLGIDFSVDLTPADTQGRYRLNDEIVLRNSA